MAVLRQATALASGAAASYVAYQLSRGDEGRRSLLLGLARADASVRPVLAAVLPHDAFVCLYSASRTPFLHALGSCSLSLRTRTDVRHTVSTLATLCHR